jgi:ribosome-binding protein aMBF1 (putative translation factor)
MDRCDACGAQAYVAVEVNGSELLYCAHHARKYEEKLRPVATSWHDETSRLSE